MKCDFCGMEIDGLPFNCRRCGLRLCHTHRFPENHNCSANNRSKHRHFFYTRKKGYYDVEDKYKSEYVGIKKDETKTYINTFDTLKGFAKFKYYKVKYWLNEREHRTYPNWNAFAFNILWIMILLLSFSILYDNIEKLNEIVLWFLPLGGTLLLINGYYLLKYVYIISKRVRYWYTGERNGIKYLLCFLILVLVWSSYQNRDSIFNGFLVNYEKTNFTAILPIGISGDIPNNSPFSKKTIDTVTESVSQSITDMITPEPISNKTMNVEKAILKYTNVERKANGLIALNWDSELAIVARDHSFDMSKNNFFEHENLRGEDPTARAKRHGYHTYKSLSDGWYSDGIGENIGKMPTGNVEGMGYVSNDVDSIAKAQVDSWMNSPGHRANILDPQYTSIGVGVAYDGLYYFSTQDFY